MHSSLSFLGALFALSILTSARKFSITETTTISLTRDQGAGPTVKSETKSILHRRYIQRDQSIASDDVPDPFNTPLPVVTTSPGSSPPTTSSTDSSQSTGTTSDTSGSSSASSSSGSDSQSGILFSITSANASSTSGPTIPLVTGQTSVKLFNLNIGNNGSYSTTTYIGKLLALADANTVYAVDCYLTMNTSVCVDAVTITQGSAMFVRADAKPTQPTTGRLAAKRQALVTAPTPTIVPTGAFLSCSLAPSPTSAVCVEQILLPTASATVRPAIFGEGLNNTVVLTSTFAPGAVVWDMLIITSGIEILVGNTTSTTSASTQTELTATRIPVGPTAVSPEITQSQPQTSQRPNVASFKRPKLVSVAAIGIVSLLAHLLI